MKIKMLKSAILDATVTEADLNYIGSITIDADLAEKANMKAGEYVLIVDQTNGSRLETYVIIGRRGSGIICMNGAAAHLINKNDKVAIMTFEWTNKELIPLFVLVDEGNRFAKYC